MNTELEAIIECLGDDAAKLREANPECEIAANMDEAADELTRLRAEVEDLRATLKSLVDGTNAYGDHGRWSVNMQTVLKARAVLKDGK